MEDTIKKASQIQSWSRPYLLIPFWKNDYQDTIYKDFPGLSCFLDLEQPSKLLQHQEKCLVMPADLRRFVQKLYRDGSFSALCVLTVLELVVVVWNGDENIVFEDDKNGDPNKKDHDGDDKLLLLVEGWPLIQEQISWMNCCNLFQRIQSLLHMVTLPNPLAEYAKHLPSLSAQDFNTAIRVAYSHKMIPKTTSNRLQASQFLLDHVESSTSSQRVVGILLEHPLLQKQSILLSQSCLPNACLELSTTTEADDTASSTAPKCNLISLYDLNLKQEPLTVSTRPPPNKCSCFKCFMGREEDPFMTLKHFQDETNHLMLMQRLGHVLFQDQQFDRAQEFYRWCHDQLVSPRNDETTNNTASSSETNATTLAADLWHSIAAVKLTQHHFLKAQRHWKEGSQYQSHHAGIRLQLEKQMAYHYFREDDQNPTRKQIYNRMVLPIYQAIGSSRQLFVTPNMVSSSTCYQLTEWAEEYANGKDDGWTTSRHYAVPTTDIPVHTVPKLLDWFVNWMEFHVAPLLRAQFEPTDNNRFYVHDAFLVRYQDAAKSSSHFLPLHFDESTHSMVLALNDGFDGGGTYFYKFDKTITPTTGSLITFRGNQLLHGGNVVTRGVRYVLAVFLFLDGNDRKEKTNETALNIKLKMSEKQTNAIMSETLVGSKRQKTSDSSGFSFGFF